MVGHGKLLFESVRAREAGKARRREKEREEEEEWVRERVYAEFSERAGVY